MAAIVLSLFAVPSAQASTELAQSAPVREARAGGQTRVDGIGQASRSERCKSARVGLAWYRGRQRDWLKLRGLGRDLGRTDDPTKSAGVAVSRDPQPRKPRNCADARYLAKLAKARSLIARYLYERWVEERRTLHDFPFADGARAWPRAVEEVQRVFPGTEGWLLSCSAAEGGHGRWVGYGGQGYSTWLRDSDTVGGPLQFRYSTFTGMYRRGAEYAQARGFRVPQFADYTTAWRSALGQALAGGWARFTGNDNSHWSASWSRGC